MLVLSRKISEKIVIIVPPSTETQTIEVEVRRVAGNRVTLATAADKSVRILRNELKDAAEAIVAE